MVQLCIIFKCLNIY